MAGFLLMAASGWAIEIRIPEEVDTSAPAEESRAVAGAPTELETANGQPVEEPTAPPGTGPPEISPAHSRKPRAHWFGLRFGYVIPGPGSKEDYAGTLVYGFYYRPRREGKRLEYELGMDYGSSASVSRDSTAGLFLARVAALYYPSGTWPLYFLGGGEVHVEQVHDGDYSLSEGVVGATVDLGAGLTLVRRKVDLRAAYSFLLGSNNIPGATFVTIGYTF